MTNEEIARQLRAQAAELASQGESLYRVRAFRQAAMAVLTQTTEVAEALESHGRKGLERIPGVGRSIAEAIERICQPSLVS